MTLTIKRERREQLHSIGYDLAASWLETTGMPTSVKIIVYDIGDPSYDEGPDRTFGARKFAAVCVLPDGSARWEFLSVIHFHRAAGGVPMEVNKFHVMIERAHQLAMDILYPTPSGDETE